MCGRIKLETDVTQLVRDFDFRELLNLQPRWNVAPGQDIAVVFADEERHLATMRWGLIPYWAKDAKIGYKAINARAEGIATKPMFREALVRRRCLVLADGFYEWRTENKVKQPHLFAFEDGRAFAFAGLWERWRGPEGEVRSCTIVTTTANATMAPYHERMPVILDPADHEGWLRGVAGEELLRPCPEEWLLARPVNRRLNDWRNDDAGLLQPDMLV